MISLRGNIFRPSRVYNRMKHLVFLLLPVLASCRITINIQASNSSSTAFVYFQGSDAAIISDQERTTFGITDEVLRNAVKKYSGGKPKDVFLHSPTPWNDLYKTYGWEEVKRILKPVKSKTFDVQSETVVLARKELDNNSTRPVKFDASVMQEVQDIVKSKWNKAGVLDIEEPITYQVNGLTIFSFTSPWGKDAVEIKKVTIGSTSSVEVVLEAGQMLSATLTATKVTMIIEVDYTTNLRGHLACNYPKRYNGHHFWRYDINAVLDDSELIKRVDSSEVISVKFYTDPKIVVTNKNTGAKLSEVTAVLVTE